MKVMKVENKDKKVKKEKKSKECQCNQECHCNEDCKCGEKCNCKDECSCTENNDELTKLKEENQSLNEKILRISAEMQNMIRRNNEDRAKLLKYDGENFITEILPIIDNFEQAIKMDDNNLSDEVSKFLSGFKMIYGNLLETLKKYEVKEIDCLNKEFDEDCMHAVLTDNDKNFEDNIVLDVMQKGYIYKDKVLRPAMVKVNNKESE